MRKLIFVCCFLQLILLPEMQAQKITEKAVSGTYMLGGVMETAAGFELKPDHTFEYGFTYGAADKWGKGTWKLAGNNVILNSHNKQPEQDFTLKLADNSYNRGIRIKVIYAQNQPLQYVKCRLGEETSSTDAKGEVYFKDIRNGILEIYHPIYSLRVTRLNLSRAQTNFEIALATDLSEVFFNNFELVVLPGELIATQLPGMPPEDAAGNLKRYVFSRKK